jgi:hypothetical protein
MADTERSGWLRAVVLAGLAYVVIGFGFARLPGRGWRLAAWAISSIVYLLHILYGMNRRRAAGAVAFHAGLAAALGGFGLAVGATIHAVSTATYRGTYGIALVAWPVLTGVPAFVVAWLIVSALARKLLDR